MFKDVFVLKKTSWHVKMMRYVWGLEYKDFSHMCPYWWLSVFNFLVFPFLFAIKEIFKFLSIILPIIIDYIFIFFKELTNILFKPIFTYFDKVHKEQKLNNLHKEIAKEDQELFIKRQKYEMEKLEYEEFIKSNPDIKGKTLKEIAFTYKPLLHILFKINDSNRFIRHRYYLDDEIKDLYQEAKNHFTKSYNDIDYEKEKMIARKQYINKINNIVRPFIKVLGYLIGSIILSILLYGLWLSLPYIGNFFVTLFHGLIYLILSVKDLFVYCYKIIKKVNYKSISIIIIVCILIVLVFFLFYEFACFIDCKRYKYHKKKNSYKTFLKIENFLNYMFKPFIYIFKYIKEFFFFLKKSIYFIIQMLKNQCPAIKWED